MKDVAIKVESIQKSFGSNIVLKDINFKLLSGEILSFIGENGAGKSTLMKILCGIYSNYSGKILDKNNNELYFSSPMKANNFGISMIYQEINVEYDLSIAENIMLGLWDNNHFGLINWKVMRSKATEILNKLGFDLDIHIPVRNLAASFQQIVCIARALARSPKILILDEPTASLTDNESKKLFEVIEKLRDEGICCIYISHKLSEVFHISDRIIVLRDGLLISTYENGNYDQKKIIQDMVGKNISDNQKQAISKNNQEKIRIENFSLKNPHNPKINLINNVSFSAKKGEILGIAGIVGSGRSELLRAIYGVYPRNTGQIYLDGQSVQVKNSRDAIRYRIGFLTEERKKDGYVGSMNIRQNASLSILHKITKMKFFLSYKKESHIVRYYLQKMNFRGSSHESSIYSLSGGNQQKVIFSKILMSDSDILLLDEPTRGIDIGAKSEIYEMIEELRQNGITILLVSSELPELIHLCSRIVVLRDGSICGELEAGEFSEERILHLASFGEAESLPAGD